MKIVVSYNFLGFLREHNKLRINYERKSDERSEEM